MRNDSKQRKAERKDRALTRNAKQSYRSCGHWHTDNGYAFCKNWTPIRTPGAPY
jgi:hypothetical protein